VSDLPSSQPGSPDAAATGALEDPRADAVGRRDAVDDTVRERNEEVQAGCGCHEMHVGIIKTDAVGQDAVGQSAISASRHARWRVRTWSACSVEMPQLCGAWPGYGVANYRLAVATSWR
jgi:hypothetical protein